MSHDLIDTSSTGTAAPPAPRLLFSVEEAAELLSISRTRIFALIKAGALQSVRVGRLRRIPAAAIAGYVDQLIHAQLTPAETGDRA